LPFPGNALGKAFKRATLIPQNAFYGCFFGKCRGVECVREVDNKSQSAFPVNAIIILKALEAVFEWIVNRILISHGMRFAFFEDSLSK
jgi:hypothetical protein